MLGKSLGGSARGAGNADLFSVCESGTEEEIKTCSIAVNPTHVRAKVLHKTRQAFAQNRNFSILQICTDGIRIRSRAADDGRSVN